MTNPYVKWIVVATSKHIFFQNTLDFVQEGSGVHLETIGLPMMGGHCCTAVQESHNHHGYSERARAAAVTKLPM